MGKGGGKTKNEWNKKEENTLAFRPYGLLKQECFFLESEGSRMIEDRTEQKNQASFRSRLSRSAIMAINSEFVGFPLTLETV